MTIELQVPAMTCGHCVRAVTDAALGVDPVAKVDVDLTTKRVRIVSALPEATFRAALAEEGYEPA